jgi:DNA-binding transcriptional ArsR family regulator
MALSGTSGRSVVSMITGSLTSFAQYACTVRVSRSYGIGYSGASAPVPSPAPSSIRKASTQPVADPVDRRIVKALSHPLRTRILQLLSEGVASPNEMAKALDEPLGNVSYHVRILLDHECIELVETKPRRGALEHFYRPLIRPMLGDAEWHALSPELRQQLTGRTLSDLFSDARGALEAGGFDGERAHVIRMLLDLDDEGWTAMTGLVERTLDEVMRIQADSVNRRAPAADGSGDGAGTIGLVVFERP